VGRNRRTRQARPIKKAGAIEKVDVAGEAGLRPATTELLLGLLIVLAGIWAYSNSLDGVFVLDDVRAIVLNPTLHSFSDAFSPPPQSTVSGRPIANLSFAMSRTFGDGPRSFHVTNIAIHVLAALLVFGVVRRTLSTTSMYSRFGDVAAPLAFAVALIWVVHPLTTSAVTYVVQRVESLMALFYLLTVYAAIRAVTAPSERGHRRLWTALAIVSCALGMATKEVMVTAPAAVALWLWVFESPRFQSVSRSSGGAAAGKFALLGGLAAAWVIFGVLVYDEHRSASIAHGGGIVWRYLLTQAHVIVHYLWLAFVPTKLVFLYTWPLATSLSDGAAPAALVLVLVVASVAGLARRHPLGFAGAWFFLILAPTSSVIPIVTEVAAEHRMYLPLVPLIASVVGVSFAVARTLVGESRRTAWAIVAIAVIVAGTAGVQTRARNRDYASEEALWRDTVTKDPRNQRAHVAYGSVLAAHGRAVDARNTFDVAVALDPSDPVAQGRLGHLYGLAHEDTDAVEHLQRAHDLQPGNPLVTTELAGILADSRDPMVRNPARALPLAEEAVRLTGRRDAAAIEVLAVTQAYLGHAREAVSLIEEAVEVARRTGDPRLIELEQRLAFYRSRTSPR